MLQPLRPSNPVQPKVNGRSTPAPVGGWNARDSIADMPVDDAIRLDNWFPETSRVRIRRGHSSFATGMTGDIDSLMVYANGTKQEMFAAVGEYIYDVSSTGAVGSAEVSGMTSARWQYVNFGTSASQYLLAFNGADTPRLYDGTTWSTTSITGSGLTPSDLIHVNEFKERLFLIEKDKLGFWYLGVSAIAGAATYFNLAQYCTLGGYLMAMGTWTRDGGDGLDDIAVFYTSRGEVLIFQGTDPGDATAWSMVGVFPLGSPVGRRCMAKAGPDLQLITQDGVIPLSNALGKARSNPSVALSDKIRNAMNDAVRANGSKFGWELTLYPRGPWFVLNVPIVENEEYHQYVANTDTGAWCRFTGMNANTWAVYNDELYFGGDGAVYKADNGLNDNGADIDADVQQAYTYLGQSGRLKRFTMIRPLFVSDGTLGILLKLNIDFEQSIPTGSPTFTSGGSATWNTSDWNTTDWANGASTKNEWLTVAGVGYAGSIRIRASSQGINVFWNATDWRWEPSTGGAL